MAKKESSKIDFAISLSKKVDAEICKIAKKIEEEKNDAKRFCESMVNDFIIPEFDKLMLKSIGDETTFRITFYLSPFGCEYYIVRNSLEIYLGSNANYGCKEFKELSNNPSILDDFNISIIKEETGYFIQLQKSYSTKEMTNTRKLQALTFIDTVLNPTFNALYESQPQAGISLHICLIHNNGILAHNDDFICSVTNALSMKDCIINAIDNGYANTEGVYETKAWYLSNANFIIFSRTYFKEDEILKEKARAFIESTVKPCLKTAYELEKSCYPSVRFFLKDNLKFWTLSYITKNASNKNMGFVDTDYEIVKKAAEISYDEYKINSSIDTNIRNITFEKLLNSEFDAVISFYLKSFKDDK